MRTLRFGCRADLWATMDGIAAKFKRDRVVVAWLQPGTAVAPVRDAYDNHIQWRVPLYRLLRGSVRPVVLALVRSSRRRLAIYGATDAGPARAGAGSGGEGGAGDGASAAGIPLAKTIVAAPYTLPAIEAWVTRLLTGQVQLQSLPGDFPDFDGRQ